ncbi:MAG TPA: hypothetical protein VK509_23185 [Polyangiales bacterium]|nr:hypothetical protein [Polyangiales bacterium]
MASATRFMVLLSVALAACDGEDGRKREGGASGVDGQRAGESGSSGSGGSTGGGGAGGTKDAATGASAAADAAIDGGMPTAGSTSQPNPRDAGGIQPPPVKCVAQVSLASTHSCAVRNDGTLWCWGSNRYGQLGAEPASSPVPTPTRVAALGSDVAEVATGDGHTCARKKDGAVLCWGLNSSGQLGNGGIDGETCLDTSGAEMKCNPVPTEVTALGDARHVVAGELHSCALKADGSVLCWGGYSEFGVVGSDRTGEQTCSMNRLCAPSPRRVASMPAADELVSGALGRHTCARAADGALWCWGLNQHGQLGHDTPELSGTPLHAAESLEIVHAATGLAHTCALDPAGALYCWGSNEVGQLGNGTTNASASPVKLAPLDDGATSGPAAALASGGAHNCALRKDGTVWCWGSNRRGQLGIGAAPTQSTLPAAVDALGADTVGIAVGAQHSCAIESSGELLCWGDNSDGQLGDGTSEGETCDGDRVCRWVPVKASLPCP